MLVRIKPAPIVLEARRAAIAAQLAAYDWAWEQRRIDLEARFPVPTRCEACGQRKAQNVSE